jgi:tRNA-2-methylthio-N6-dimethylallyladenosine synthase
MKKVFLETFGCQMNVSDSERVASMLEKEGFELTSEETEAEVVILNTCSVREKAEQKLYTRVGEIRNGEGPRPVIGVMGCVAQLEGADLFAQKRGIDFIAGTRAVGRIPAMLRDVLGGGREVIDLGDREDDYDWTVSDTQRHSAHVAFVPIIEGCNKFCTYCIVPFSRGREKSLSADAVVAHVESLRREGVKEVHLIGQNVNSYRPSSESGLEGFAGATPFSRLLRAVAATGIERVKFTTSFPRDFHPDIVDALEEHENLCNWVHLPVQSGSDRVLRLMKRGHTADRYKKIVDRIRGSKREITMTTDIIVGFPAETEEDFLDTVALAEYARWDSGYVFKYSPRPGTPAFQMEDDVTPEEKTRRFLVLEQVMKRSQGESLASTVGRIMPVLAERPSSRDATQLNGHTSCHRIVNFIGSPEAIGSIVPVEILEAKANTLFGRAV